MKALIPAAGSSLPSQSRPSPQDSSQKSRKFESESFSVRLREVEFQLGRAIIRRDKLKSAMWFHTISLFSLAAIASSVHLGGLISTLVVIAIIFSFIEMVRTSESAENSSGLFFFLTWGKYRAATEEADLIELQRSVLLGSLAVEKTGTTTEDSLASSHDYSEQVLSTAINNNRDNHTLFRDHANKSFFVSLSVCVTGFLIIAYGIFLHYTDHEFVKLSVISGLIIEVVSGLFFFLYTKSLKELRQRQEHTDRVQMYTLSLQTIGRMKPGKDREEHLGQLLSQLSKGVVR